MSSSPPSKYAEESHTEKLKKKAMEAPFVPLGLAGMAAAITWGIVSYKHRGNMSPSIFFMHLRVKAQSMIVGAMAIGVGYSVLNEFVFNKDKRDKYILHKDTEKKAGSKN